MSYILDALRRAEAERERGAVPSLQSQQQAIADDDAVAARPKTLVWAVAGLALALIASLAWTLFGGTAAPARAPIEGSIGPVPAPLPAQPTSPAPSPIAITSTKTDPTNLATTPPPSPPPLPEVAAQPRARTSVDAKRVTSRPAAATSATGAAAAKETGASRVYAPAELPDEIRRDLPKLAIGGSSYSSDAASRMVMINGQIFHEGDRLAPGLVLERIRPKSAVLGYKGWRYEVAF